MAELRYTHDTIKTTFTEDRLLCDLVEDVIIIVVA